MVLLPQPRIALGCQFVARPSVPESGLDCSLPGNTPQEKRREEKRRERERERREERESESNRAPSGRRHGQTALAADRGLTRTEQQCSGLPFAACVVPPTASPVRPRNAEKPQQQHREPAEPNRGPTMQLLEHPEGFETHKDAARTVRDTSPQDTRDTKGVPKQRIAMLFPKSLPGGSPAPQSPRRPTVIYELPHIPPPKI